ncbi:hypothetical protein E2C01_086997 [Portunus trituberculatus]|uniref:Uncharacterized protein n=1 Tax=Portunus trituberculatus TaxID=210409 RepID=A0A5B7J6Z8_PORTR|nr:hypothetical protein [Portunus trituberculatus]
MNSDTAIICGAARTDLWRPLGVGVAYVPAITSLVLPAMMGRHKGAVVNVCSPTANLSLSRFHVYTTAKPRSSLLGNEPEMTPVWTALLLATLNV